MTGEAAPQAAGTGANGVAARVRADALSKLRHGWGEAYRIGWNPRRGWWARRRDDAGEELTAADAGALWDAICGDYIREPVSRDVGPGKGSLP